MITAITKGLLTTEEVLTASIKYSSASTKLILVTNKLMSANEKRMSVTSKVILATEEVINSLLKKYLGHYKCDFGQQTDVNH